MGKICAVIAAAGKGKRMGANINKQFLSLKGKPILYYTLKAFNDCELIDEIVISAAEDEIDFCREEIVKKYNISKVTNIVAGGKERKDSVFNALTALKDCDIVLIHDGARPFITSRIIEDGIKYAGQFGASACGVVPKDTIKIKNKNGFSESTLNRDELFSVQTPQCFKYDIILKCHEKINIEETAFKDAVSSITDDTSVVERYGYKVYLYEGSYTNIKITTQEDIITAEKFIESGIQ
jgi:2-C-methyl-D-erythritol 4-phosphate cytidylyltransferase